MLGSKAFFPASTICSIILGCEPVEAEDDELAIVSDALVMKRKVEHREVLSSLFQSVLWIFMCYRHCIRHCTSSAQVQGHVRPRF